jgi:hypothetical protein
MVRRKGNHPFRLRQWLAVFLFLPGFGAADTTILDRSVALIDGQVLTQSELDFEARILLVQAGGVTAAFAPLDDSTLRKVLDSVISQRLETAEADKLKAYPLEEGELDRAMGSFVTALGGPKELDRFLKQHEADESMLAVVIARTLRTQRVLDGKLRLKAQVSEAEAKRLQADRGDLKGLSVPAVRQKLFAERFTTLTASELAAVRKASAVRLLGPYSAGADGGAL